MDDWTNRFVVIGEDVAGEIEEEEEEERREEERRRLAVIRARRAEEHRREMAAIRARCDEARRQVEQHGRIVDTDLANCFSPPPITMNGCYTRDVM